MRYLIHSEVNILKKKDKYDDFENKTDLNIKIANIFKIYSICNTIISENDTVDFANFYKRTYNYKRFAELVNSNFDCIVLSIDNIDKKKIKVLDNITRFLRLVNIKVLIVGCNFMSESFLSSNIHKTTIIDFVKETLKHTNIIGVTENYSAKILNNMGFIKDKDYYICGHPSFFYNKNYLMNTTSKISKNSKICVNRNLSIIKNDDIVDNFFINLYRECKNMYTLNTFLYEFYSVINYDNSCREKHIDVNYRKMNNAKYRVYKNIEGYLEELSYYDFCIGERAEDCIIALSHGIYTLIITSNLYDESLAEYHKIPYIKRTAINNKIGLTKLVENAKYTTLDTQKEYKKLFNRYINFFKINGICINENVQKYTPFKKLLCKKYKNDLNISLNIPEEYFIDEFKHGHYVSSVKKQAWAIELDLLKKFQDICEKNNLRYFVDAGTLLGAVRHKGFIPWDDDIDIIMFPDDYDKFVNIVKKEMPELVQDSEEVPCVWLTRLRNPNTTFISEKEFMGKYNYNQGLFIDIFPMHNVPEDDCEYRNFARYLKMIKECTQNNYKIYWEYERDNIDMYKKSIELHKKFDSESRKYNNDDTNVTAILTNCSVNSFRGQEIRKWKKDFENIIMLDFEMLKVAAPVGYDNVLKKLYGNYMIIKKNGSLHGKMYIDPINSYKKYLTK